MSLLVSTAALATICVGAASVAGGIGCAADLPICPLSRPSSVQQLFASPTLVSRAYVNSRTGATLMVRPQTSLRAAQAGPGPMARRPLQKAAKVAMAGLLTTAAITNPAIAGPAEDARIADLMKAWNAEYGGEYGTWDMSGYRPEKKAAAPVAVAAPEVKAPAAPKKAVSTVDPFEQVMAEWNREYGSQYGTWDMTGYKPLEKKAAPAPQPVPAPEARPAIEPVKAAPPAPVPEPAKAAPPAPVPVPEPVKAAPPAPAPEPIKAAPAPEPVQAAKVEAPPAPVPVAPAPPAVAAPAATKDDEGGSPLGLVLGGLALLIGGFAALSGNTGSSEAEAPSTSTPPTTGASPAPPTPTDPAAPSSPPTDTPSK